MKIVSISGAINSRCCCKCSCDDGMSLGLGLRCWIINNIGSLPIAELQIIPDSLNCHLPFAFLAANYKINVDVRVCQGNYISIKNTKHTQHTESQVLEVNYLANDSFVNSITNFLAICPINIPNVNAISWKFMSFRLKKQRALSSAGGMGIGPSSSSRKAIFNLKAFSYRRIKKK